MDTRPDEPSREAIAMAIDIALQILVPLLVSRHEWISFWRWLPWVRDNSQRLIVFNASGQNPRQLLCWPVANNDGWYVSEAETLVRRIPRDAHHEVIPESIDYNTAFKLAKGMFQMHRKL